MVTTNLKKCFGLTIRRRREHLNLTQGELAGRAGLHRTYVSDLERGARNPSLQSIKRLADALAIPISGLFEEIEFGPTENTNVAGELVSVRLPG